MSVLIKGMKIPENGVTIHISPAGIAAYYWDKNEKIEAVEIPPHGRLIDATKLCELCDTMAEKCGDSAIWNQFRTVIEWSPTIVEEEKE